MFYVAEAIFHFLKWWKNKTVKSIAWLEFMNVLIGTFTRKKRLFAGVTRRVAEWYSVYDGVIQFGWRFSTNEMISDRSGLGFVCCLLWSWQIQKKWHIWIFKKTRQLCWQGKSRMRGQTCHFVYSSKNATAESSRPFRFAKGGFF